MLGFIYGLSFTKVQSDHKNTKNLITFSLFKLFLIPIICYYLLILPILETIILVVCFFSMFWLTIIKNVLIKNNNDKSHLNEEP